jgi:hypothetical protein
MDPARTAGVKITPAGDEPNRPNIARIYACLLGSEDHYQVDRVQVANIIEAATYVPRLAAAAVTHSAPAASGPKLAWTNIRTAALS